MVAERKYPFKVVRIFRVHIHPEMREEYEDMFINVAVPFVEAHDGCLEAWPGKPVDPASNEYVFYSAWKSLDDIIRFAGTEYSVAAIPPGMQKFIINCWVYHYQSF